MNREQCYEMWNKAGEEALQKTKDDFGVSITELRAIQAECFAAAIRSATKDEDAKICDWLALERDSIGRVSLQMGADAIRASK